MRNRATAGGKRRAPVPSAKAKANPAGSSQVDLSDTVASLAANLANLTVDVPLANKPKRKAPIPPFRFFDLPSELRLKIYAHHFANVEDVLDLDHDNYKRIHQKLAILRTCRQVYQEATYAFYSIRSVRLFPIYGKFFKAKKPLLARMSANQRANLTTLQLRLGPGFNRPPRGWVVNEALGLKDCTGVQRIKVFVECDPSNDIFTGFRQSDGFYEKFSQDLLDGVLSSMPWCEVVEFDANPSVKKAGAMMSGLLEAAGKHGRKLAWGPERGWDDSEEVKEPAPIWNHSAIGIRRGDGMLHGHYGHGHGRDIKAVA